MKHLLGSIALCTILLGAVPVTAHKAKDSGPVTALHGGQALTAGPYHLELVATDGELTLYVTDHSDTSITTDGARAKATIQHGTEKARTQVDLEPSGENMLKGTGTFTINPDTGIIVFIKLPEQEAHAARFTPRQTKGGSAHTDGKPHQRKAPAH
ncbi:MAG: hypothetical protein OEV99_08310 [Nitrospira sp.]|nr:hypothetical protein [Nitrospira sp.]MDH4369837.1 hypothetical protein [Nitrospira sp.]MDH5497293.1 hypothetical protein [Nitrospira sp.]MDH5725430.1 hypothetical protein [Nitrospira sp.]